MRRVLFLVGLVCLTLLAVGFVVTGAPQTQEPANPAAATVKSQIMMTLDETKWETARLRSRPVPGVQ